MTCTIVFNRHCAAVSRASEPERSHTDEVIVRHYKLLIRYLLVVSRLRDSDDILTRELLTVGEGVEYTAMLVLIEKKSGPMTYIWSSLQTLLVSRNAAWAVSKSTIRGLLIIDNGDCRNILPWKRRRSIHTIFPYLRNHNKSL